MRKHTSILLHMNSGKILRLIVALLLLIVFLYSGWKIFSIEREYWQSEESYEAMMQEYVSKKLSELSVEEPESETIEPMLTETAPISVNFDILREEYPDVVGWLYCPDTPINYPVVQAEDNNYYLHHLLDGTYNSSGSIFMDYRCPSDFSGWNSIVYGHNMKNDAMFGTLQDYKEQTYYDAHPVLYLLTPVQDYRIDLIGGYTTPSTAEDTYGLPDTQDGRDALISKARQQSTFQTETAVNDGEQLITLSTCAYDYDLARYVLVGILRPLMPSEKGGNLQ